jgi:hypothetical protein
VGHRCPGCTTSPAERGLRPDTRRPGAWHSLPFPKTFSEDVFRRRFRRRSEDATAAAPTCRGAGSALTEACAPCPARVRSRLPRPVNAAPTPRKTRRSGGSVGRLELSDQRLGGAVSGAPGVEPGVFDPRPADRSACQRSHRTMAAFSTAASTPRMASTHEITFGPNRTYTTIAPTSTQVSVCHSSRCTRPRYTRCAQLRQLAQHRTAGQWAQGIWCRARGEGNPGNDSAGVGPLSDGRRQGCGPRAWERCRTYSDCWAAPGRPG